MKKLLVVCAFFAHTAGDNKSYKVKYYNLHILIDCDYIDNDTVDENGFLHSYNNNPARKHRTIINSIVNGAIIKYFKHGNAHNLYGPSEIGEFNDSSYNFYGYAIDGKFMWKKDWEIESNRLLMLGEL